MDVMLLSISFVLLAIAGGLACIANEEYRNVSLVSEETTSVLVTGGGLIFAHLLTGTAVVLGLASVAVFGFVAYNATWSDIINKVFEAFTFFLPALAANQGAGLARKLRLPGARTPISERWLGEAKTWGSYYGILLALVVIWIQNLMPMLQSTLVSYQFWPGLLLGVLMGVGATWGDHFESLFKRRLEIPSGKPFWPLDQTDFAIGSAVLTLPLIGPLWLEVLEQLLLFLFLMLVLHPVGNYIGYSLGLRNRVL